jgi:hypothetical protein
MGKNKWLHRQPQHPAAPLAPPIGPDAAQIEDDEDVLDEVSADGVAPGQVWEGVIVPNRAVNVLSLTPGSKLLPLRIDGPFNDGTNHYCASFVGESMTKIRVDAEMLKTGKMRA